MAAQWERLKTGLGIGPEPVQEPESLPSQLLHQLDEATTLSKTQVPPVNPQSDAAATVSALNILAFLQRVYGFVICLGLGLLFGFLVGDRTLSVESTGASAAVLWSLIMLSWFVVQRFFFDASQVCHTLHFSKPFVHRQVCLEQSASTTYCHVLTPETLSAFKES